MAKRSRHAALVATGRNRETMGAAILPVSRCDTKASVRMDL
jgi:hypothetical protein